MAAISELLARAREGDRAAFDDLFEHLYPVLKQVARARLAGHQRGPVVDTTALVHECYLRLLNTGRLTPADRAHFIAYSARVMRSVVVDAVRAAESARRGGGLQHVPLDTQAADSVPQAEQEVLEIDRALEDLARLSPRLAQVVEMRYFAGMTEREIGEALGVTERTVRRDWDKARLLLRQALAP